MELEKVLKKVQDDSRKERKEFDGRVKELEARVKKGEADRQRLNADRQTHQDEINTLNADRQTQKDEINTLNADRQTQQDEINRLNADRQTHQDEIKRLDAQLQDHAAVFIHNISSCQLMVNEQAFVYSLHLFQDIQAMDRIRMRNMLNRAQAKLAEAAGLVTNRNDYSASSKWRSRLSTRNTLPGRLQIARDLFSGVTGLQTSTTVFLQSEAGMTLVVDMDSQIRNSGDVTAHELILDRKGYQECISRVQPEEQNLKVGLNVLLDYVCTMD